MSAEKVVKGYSTPTWPHCTRAKSFLEKNGIKYENLDVAENKEARDEMIKKSGRPAVPVIEVSGEIIIGFDEAKLKEKLGLWDTTYVTFVTAADIAGVIF